MSTTSDQFPFLKLPKDIRLCVYDDVLRLHEANEIYGGEIPKWFPTRTYTNLLRTCKAIYDETSHYLYSRRTLTIPLALDSTWRELWATQEFMNCIPKERARMLLRKFEKVELVIPSAGDHYSLYVLSEDLAEFTCLMAPSLTYTPQNPDIPEHDAIGRGAYYTWELYASTVMGAEEVLTMMIADPISWPNVRVKLVGCVDGSKNDQGEGEKRDLSTEPLEFQVDV